MPKTSTHENQWAQLGAAVRLQEIRAEADAIYAAFPSLRRAQTAHAGLAVPTVGRSRRKMSSEARKRMSEGMRRYWAKRKAKEAAKASRAKA